MFLAKGDTCSPELFVNKLMSEIKRYNFLNLRVLMELLDNISERNANLCILCLFFLSAMFTLLTCRELGQVKLHVVRSTYLTSRIRQPVTLLPSE